MNLRTLPILCPPGNGVFTVLTGSELKKALHQVLYQSTDTRAVEAKWKASLDNHQNNTFILGLPSDSGGGILRGANWGPLFLRQKLYSENSIKWTDLGDIRVIPHLLHDKYLNDETISSCREYLYENKNSDLPVSPLSMAEAVLDDLYATKHSAKVLGLGGDHSLSYP